MPMVRLPTAGAPPNSTRRRDAFYCKGLAWHAKGDAGRAIAAYSVAIGIDAKDDASHYARGMARADRKDYAGAVVDFDEALELDPGNPDYAIVRKAAAQGGGEPAAKARAAATKPAGQAQNKTVGDAIEQGTIWRAQNQFDQAIEQYDIAVAADPSNAGAHTLRGFTYALKGDPDRAMADYDKAIKLDPKSTDAYFYRTAIWLQRGKSDRAIADLSTIISLQPANADAYVLRSRARAMKHDCDGIIADSTKVIRLRPTDAEAWFNRGFCWNREKQYDRAIADLDEALRLDPNHANASKERDDAAMTRAANKQAPTTGGAAATPRPITKSGIAL